MLVEARDEHDGSWHCPALGLSELLLPSFIIPTLPGEGTASPRKGQSREKPSYISVLSPESGSNHVPVQWMQHFSTENTGAPPLRKERLICQAV